MGWRTTAALLALVAALAGLAWALREPPSDRGNVDGVAGAAALGCNDQSSLEQQRLEPRRQHGADFRNDVARGVRKVAVAAPLDPSQSQNDGLNFIGVEPEFVSADGLGISPEQRDTSLKGALIEVERLAA